MKFFDISKLRYVSMDDLDELSAVLKKYPNPRSAYDIVNLMIWGAQFKAQWVEYNGRLFLYNETWSCILMPLGPYLSPKELLGMSRMFYEAGKCCAISYVDSEYVSQYSDYLLDFEIVKDLNTADYIYLSDRLAKLSGKKLQKKKNLISQFIRQFGEFLVEDLREEMGEECLHFSDQWLEDHPEDKDKGYKYEREALKKAFAYFQRLHLEGTVIRVNDQMVAFSVYSKQKEDMAIIHFEKFSREIKGAAQVINWETAKRLCHRYQYINREEDMGIPGLRKSKQSYQPLMILDSFKLTRKKNEDNSSVQISV